MVLLRLSRKCWDGTLTVHDSLRCVRISDDFHGNQVFVLLLPSLMNVGIVIGSDP